MSGGGFGEAWDALEEQGKEELRERRAALYRLFGAGAAEEADYSRHLGNVLAGLFGGGYYDTFAVVLRAFGFTEEQILEAIKRRCLAARLTVGDTWKAIREAGISPDAEALVSALEEVDDHGGFENNPF
jgi:hypothetical protein